MTLEELQAEFPHGSRWDITSMSTATGWERGWLREATVVGWMDGRSVVFTPPVSEHSSDHWTTAVYNGDELIGRDVMRIPDPVPPVPCPITEPTTLHSFARHGNGPGYGMGGPFDESGGYGPLTLHPAEPGATEGRYTWEQPT